MNYKEFVTERLQLAIYLHATNGLPFSRCQHGSDGRVQFIFSDPNQIGCELELAFERGATTRATDIFASQKFIRRKMSQTFDKPTIHIGETENGFISRNH